MCWRMFGILLVAGGLAAIPPQGAQAQLSDSQVSVQLQILWEWGGDRWRPHRPAHVPVAHVPAPRSVRVPPGHLPPPGFCRLWYPGRPPGHQPPPQPCAGLFHFAPPAGAVLVATPGHPHGRGRGAKGKKGKRW